MLPGFGYSRPDSLAEAQKQLSAPGTVILAGGTDLLGCLRERILSPEKLVSLMRLSGLKGIKETPDGSLRIGALTTISEIAADPLIRDRYPGLAQAAAEVASPQLRNQGTLGGNLCQKPRCWYYRGEFDCLRKGGGTCFAIGGENVFHAILGGDPCFFVHPSDTAPALTALKAEVKTSSPKGGRAIPLEKLYVLPEESYEAETVLGPAEMVTEIVLPPPPPGLKSSYRKVRARRSWDFALAGLALAVSFEGETVVSCRAVLSGAAPKPWVAEGIGETIIGQKITPDLARKAAEAALAEARPMEQNGYKIPLFKGVIQEELLKIAGGGAEAGA